MKINHSHTSHPSTNGLPDHTFWHAFQELLNRDTIEAEAIFQDALLSEPPPRDSLQLMASHFLSPWAVLNSTERHGTLGYLATKGEFRELERLCLKKEIIPVQAIHAIIECGLQLSPSPIFCLSGRERIALLQTYEIEAAIFARSRCVTRHNVNWLCQRRIRAVRFVNELADCLKKQKNTPKPAVHPEDPTGFCSNRWLSCRW